VSQKQRGRRDKDSKRMRMGKLKGGREIEGDRKIDREINIDR